MYAICIVTLSRLRLGVGHDVLRLLQGRWRRINCIGSPIGLLTKQWQSIIRHIGSFFDWLQAISPFGLRIMQHQIDSESSSQRMSLSFPETNLRTLSLYRTYIKTPLTLKTKQSMIALKSQPNLKGHFYGPGLGDKLRDTVQIF